MVILVVLLYLWLYASIILIKITSQDSGKILTCGFGIGLSLGIVGITVEPQNCFPVFRVKERYDDGLSFEDYK